MLHVWIIFVIIFYKDILVVSLLNEEKCEMKKDIALVMASNYWAFQMTTMVVDN